MRISTLFAAIILTTTVTYGQKCKYLTNTVSGMDGSRLVITNPEVFSKNKAEVWAKMHQDSLIVFSIVLKEEFPVQIAKGNQLTLGEDDETLLTLEVNQDVSRDASSKKSVTVYAVLSKSDFSKIREKAINHIRIQTDDDWIDLKARSKKELKAVNQVLKCIACYL